MVPDAVMVPAAAAQAGLRAWRVAVTAVPETVRAPAKAAVPEVNFQLPAAAAKLLGEAMALLSGKLVEPQPARRPASRVAATAMRVAGVRWGSGRDVGMRGNSGADSP